MSTRHQKKIAMINDLSGYGRCSLTVALPILSAMRVQCCPVPTSILSRHTGFPVYYFDDYTDHMEAYIEKWKELGLTFDGIATGFLGSERQIEIVKDMVVAFKTPETKVLVDPIMGDHGVPYATCTPAMCSRMKSLAAMADILTPNLTEACILLDLPYNDNEGDLKEEELEQLARRLQLLGPSSVVITGIRQGKYLVNVLAEGEKEVYFLKRLAVGEERPGTGDVFSSIIAGGCIRGWNLRDAAELAADFVKDCIIRSGQLQVPVQNGVCFEELLGELCQKAKD